MRKTFIFLFVCSLLSIQAHSQLMVTKLVGKDASKFGLGYGLFTFLDFPLPSENQSFRVELMDLAFYPTKGESFFTSTGDSRGYISIKLGYKYVFSETQSGFYIIPSAGYCRTVFLPNGQNTLYGDGIAGALEAGYSLEVGQKGHAFNFGLKYEYDRGSSTLVMQNIGFRMSYSFGMFRKGR